MTTKVISLDFELASTLDLREVGADVWTKHPDTLPILAGFAFDYADPVCLQFDWLVLEPTLSAHQLQRELLDAVKGGAEIHAWNAAFEFAVWNNICVPRFGWPALPIERFHCTMAAAACAGLPMSLDEAAVAVASPILKDKAGRALMQRMARPRSEKPLRWWHREDPGKLNQLIAYNLNDVLVEREVHKRIPRMTPRERAVWLTDQRMNQHGLPVDKKLLDALLGVTMQEMLRLNKAIALFTNCEVTSATQNAKLLIWLQDGGYPHNTLERDVLDAFIKSPDFFTLDADTCKALQIRAEAAKTSTAKLGAVANYSLIDGRARGLVQYGGAMRTLRWAGRGPQIQNFPRPLISGQNVKSAIEQLLLGADADTLRHLYGRPLDVVSSCLRGLFKPREGRTFVVADYHAIEAVVLAWLADATELLDVFRRGEDVYVYTAKAMGSENRTLGKVIRLACGYGMGPVKFLETAAAYGLTLTGNEAIAAVYAFRQTNREIVAFWHACESRAKSAINNPGRSFAYNQILFRMARPDGRLSGALLMRLPSGRHLVYRQARIENGRIMFWGVNNYTRRWMELDTYGGKLVENATQATARDLLADAVVEIDKNFPDTLCTTIHDEIIAEIDEANAPELFNGMLYEMGHPQPWAAGMPVTAAGAIIDRYGKLSSTRLSTAAVLPRLCPQDGRRPANWKGWK